MLQWLKLLMSPHVGVSFDHADIDSFATTQAPAFPLASQVLPKPATVPDYINLDDKVRLVNGGYLLPVLDQKFAGCCTAATWATARRFSSANKPGATSSRWSNPSIPWLYGMGRTRLAKPNNAPPGAALGDMAIIASEIGVLECAQYLGYDLRFYDPMTALQWEKSGPPDALLAKVGPKINSLLAFTEDDVIACLCAGLAVAFAARWYFTRTDRNGIIQSTSINPPLGHAMVIFGRVKTPVDTFYAIQNSMGSAIFSGGQPSRFPKRGTGLIPASEARASIFNRGAMFAPLG